MTNMGSWTFIISEEHQDYAFSYSVASKLDSEYMLKTTMKCPLDGKNLCLYIKISIPPLKIG